MSVVMNLDLEENNVEEEELMPNMKFFPAPEVEHVAKEIMKNYHKHLREAVISFTFKNGKWNKNGREVAGDVKVMSPYVHALTGFDFGIIINYKHWLKLDKEMRVAVLDHLLAYCQYEEDKNGNRKYKKIAPMASEFQEIVARRGAYTDYLSELQDSLEEYNANGINNND